MSRARAGPLIALSPSNTFRHNRDKCDAAAWGDPSRVSIRHSAPESGRLRAVVLKVLSAGTLRSVEASAVLVDLRV
jgi:hypothetical protein